jgi:NADH-quinone oxidoreductase subunit K
MNLQEALLVITFLFFIGMSGIVLNRNNLLVVLMSIELMLLSINLSFIYCSFQFDDLVGHICVLLILAIAATESAIGLAIICTYSFVKDNIVS